MTPRTTRPVNADFYVVDDYLSDDDRAIVRRVRGFVSERVLPVINDYWEKADFPYEILPAFGELGVAGTAIHGYGCPGMTRLQTGLVAMELWKTLISTLLFGLCLKKNSVICVRYFQVCF